MCVSTLSDVYGNPLLLAQALILGLSCPYSSTNGSDKITCGNVGPYHLMLDGQLSHGQSDIIIGHIDRYMKICGKAVLL